MEKFYNLNARKIANMGLHISGKDDEITPVALLENTPELKGTYPAWFPKPLVQVRDHQRIVFPGVGE